MRTKLLVATLASGVILTGCATSPTGTTINAQNKAAIGGLLGAVAGAGVSKATGGEKTGRDAAIGAVLGAGVGYYMQQQEARLREQTAGTGIEVTRDPVTNNINLSIPEAITFDVARYNIKSGFYPTLNKVASTLNTYNQSSIQVNGYASVEGNAAANQTLSQNRANAVAQYLVNQGVAPSRISSVGRGATTQFGSSYEQNRRVEMTILAPQSVN
ncbi:MULTISPECIES: OmpA family protein [unclassified Moraxella]|uniref:OmpA family protein n=1 Tax=unclassified Moraxella TaxID=2685852 RepID=UPI003AF5193E